MGLSEEVVIKVNYDLSVIEELESLNLDFLNDRIARASQEEEKTTEKHGIEEVKVFLFNFENLITPVAAGVFLKEKEGLFGRGICELIAYVKQIDDMVSFVATGSRYNLGTREGRMSKFFPFYTGEQSMDQITEELIEERWRGIDALDRGVPFSPHLSLLVSRVEEEKE